MAAESGLRSNVLMELRYRHVAEDLEEGTIPVAVQLEPRFHVGKKAAGYTFLGAGSIGLLKQCIGEGIVEARPDAKLVSRSYYGVWAAIHRASKGAGLDPKIQTCHGLRKYFENALDEAAIDHERKMMIEGHFAGTRAKHYTDRDLEQLRDLYQEAYPFVELNTDDAVQLKVEAKASSLRLQSLEMHLARQRVLEAKLSLLEAELDKMRGSLRVLDSRSHDSLSTG